MPSRRALFALALTLVLVIAGVGAVQAAEGRAADAERAYITDRLENAACLEDWGVDEGAVSRSVAVTGPSGVGLRVAVTMPYAHTVEIDGEAVFADTATEAVYRVTLTDTTRLEGDTVAPC
jgi:hypothetical protein